jgi:uncharacterized protein DUF2752
MRLAGSGSERFAPLNRRQRVLVRAALAAGTALLLAAGVVVLAAVPPTAASFYPKCVSYQLLGIHCPGCGLTRAAHSLLNGHLAQAFAYNPLLVLLSPYLLFALARSAWFWLWGTEPRRSVFPARYTWVILIVFVGYWVLRNVPVYPFTLLAPHEIGP